MTLWTSHIPTVTGEGEKITASLRVKLEQSPDWSEGDFVAIGVVTTDFDSWDTDPRASPEGWFYDSGGRGWHDGQGVYPLGGTLGWKWNPGQEWLVTLGWKTQTGGDPIYSLTYKTVDDGHVIHSVPVPADRELAFAIAARSHTVISFPSV